MTKERFAADKLQMPATDFDDIMRRALGVAPPIDEGKKAKPATKRALKKTEK